MPAFKRLTRADLDSLTRAELQDRIMVESDYWDRKCRRGLNPADAAAHQEFSEILHAALDPSASIDHAMRYLKTGVDNGYWDEKPGSKQ
ncbi:hypothetical protein [Streptomyces californicus]|uniref:hypothetical protein n=1 Tax=Streptomyces californicus TaxID=67351 RepID=UPI0004C1EBF8|nr:hypothetical protein [Streptomyces californicus]QRV59391.1 hypothetical protein I6J40_34595 [Streptomyces californicus]